ncbi:MAG TPA: LptA/OstA family protein, partial [Candidatus Acidoferrum sp.]|nr:LptA/OstA family protein [Candidatus Acidoferrum sp.]
MTPVRPAPFPRLRKPLAATLLLTSTLSAATALLAQPASLPDAADVDWVAMKDLTEAQRAKMADGCCGMYVEPKPPVIQGDQSAMHINGIKSNTDSESIVDLDGPVTIQQGTSWVTAEHGDYDQKRDLITLDGDIHLRRQGALMIGRHAQVNRATLTDTLDIASYLLHGPSIRGKAKALVYREDLDVITINDGVFTRCEPGDDSWTLSGEQIVLD